MTEVTRAMGKKNCNGSYFNPNGQMDNKVFILYRIPFFFQGAGSS